MCIYIYTYVPGNSRCCSLINVHQLETLKNQQSSSLTKMVHYVFQVGKYTSLMDIYEKVFVFMAPGSPIIT